MDHLSSYDIPVEGVNLEEHATLVKAKHLIYSDAYRGKTMVIGHRGGKFGPDNSMETIKAAVENQLEGIEFDVWLCKDEELMLLHGGNDGELDAYDYPNDMVFEWTKEEL